MSIIIAKIENDSCLFKSDTKVSLINGDKSVTGGNKLRLPPDEGVLKIHIPYSKMCIAFAGTVSICSDIIHNLCKTQPTEALRILQFLQQGLIDCNDDSEFIIGLVIDNKPQLFKIDNKGIESGETFWIGVKDAFDEFQPIFLEKNDSKSKLDKLSFAFGEMIKNSKINSIGDFIISASFRKQYDSFVYEEALESQSGYAITKIKERDSKVLSEGTAAEGAFTVSNLISDSTSKQAVCLYFQKGGLAYLFLSISALNISASPIQIKVNQIEDLKKIVSEKYGIELIGFSFKSGHIKYVE